MAFVNEMKVCELTPVPCADVICGVVSFGRMMTIFLLPDALIIGRMKSSWPMPLTTIASRSTSFLMSSGRG